MLHVLLGGGGALAAGGAPTALTVAAAAGPLVPGGQVAYLELSLNGNPLGLQPFTDRASELWATAAQLRQLGLVLSPDTPDVVALDTLVGLRLHYDSAEQRLAIDAPLALLDLPTTRLDATRVASSQPAGATPGLLLNYDLYGSRSRGGASGLSAFTELRAFGGNQVFSSTTLAQRRRGDGGRQDRTVRLDSSWSRSWPDRMLTLRLGDTLTDSLPWTRATRIGGVQLGSNFALQPYRITTPIPALLGAAALPSAVELFVNGMRQYEGQVPAGPFQLDTVPLISGAGHAQVVLTDAFGRSTTLDFPLYGTQQQLLRAGLSQWSVELGKVRRNYGLRSFDYGRDLVASGTWRRGLSNGFTAQAHAEASAGLANAGVGGVWRMGRTAGVLSGAASASNGHSHRGAQTSLAYSWNDRRFSLGLSDTRTHGRYADVAALHGGPPARRASMVQGGYNTLGWGSFSLGLVHLRMPDQPASRYATASWFKSLGQGATLSLSVRQNLAERHQRSLFVSLSWALDARTSAGTSFERSEHGHRFTATASRPPPSDGGLGWNTALRTGGGQNGGAGSLEYLGRHGRLAAGVNSFGRSGYAWADATGALALLGGRVFAAQHTSDAFAVVSTDGVAGVPVRLENRLVGTTDHRGMLMLTPLRAYQNNRLAIDPMDLPADVRIDRTQALVTPSDRAGTLVRFGITPIRAALVTLTDGAGWPLPLGSQVRANTHAGEAALVGYDGAVYLEMLDTHNVLFVQTSAGVCTTSFEHHPSSTGIAQIGPLRCLKEGEP